MTANNAHVRRIFGSTADDYAKYSPSTMAQAEALPVGTTRRVFKGPQRHGNWSVHLNVTAAAGSTSTLKFYFSNLPNPDPTESSHWKDSGITAIDLTATGATFLNETGHFPEWIMAEAVVATSAGSLWAYVRSEGVEV